MSLMSRKPGEGVNVRNEHSKVNELTALPRQVYSRYEGLKTRDLPSISKPG